MGPVACAAWFAVNADAKEGANSHEPEQEFRAANVPKVNQFNDMHFKATIVAKG
jgi:hypothetical protein